MLFPLASCMIPYMYGKLIYPATFPAVTLKYTNGDISKEMLLLDKTDKEVTLLNILDSDAAIVYVVQKRRDDINTIRQYGDKDLLNVILQYCNWAPPSNGPANAQK